MENTAPDDRPRVFYSTCNTIGHVECQTDENKQIYSHEQLRKKQLRGRGAIYVVCFPCPDCEGKRYGDNRSLREYVRNNMRAIGYQAIAYSTGIPDHVADDIVDSVYRGGQ